MDNINKEEEEEDIGPEDGQEQDKGSTVVLKKKSRNLFRKNNCISLFSLFFFFRGIFTFFALVF